MSDARDYAKASREALKRLRQERTEQVRAANAANNLVRAERKKIVADLDVADGPRSVRQIATSTQLSTDCVLWHVAAMRKYGHVVETPEKDGDYYTYALTPEAKAGGRRGEKTAAGASDQADDDAGEG
jgi:predicted transcriptional regulator